MKLHRNAKTTPHMRALLVERIQHQQWTPHAAASAAGISIRSVYKWLARHRTGGSLHWRIGRRRPIVSRGGHHPQ